MVNSLLVITQAVLDSLPEAVVVFDTANRVVYVNGPARRVLGLDSGELPEGVAMLTELERRGARLAPLWVEGEKLGEVVFLPVEQDAAGATLAERERETILATLNATCWRLGESARRLGISRTTLWRRLNAYGLKRQGRS
jgi:transcriptional regulator of acetoin/glycerol metabolism